MTNDDLKRLYGINAVPQRNKDFVRYGENGEIITDHDAIKGNEVVNYRTLIRHAGGVGADVNYRGAWISGMEIAQYDVVYINTSKTRQYYMAINDITSSTISPDIDTDNYNLYLEVERNIQRDTLPTASEEYVDDIIQYIGETNQNYTNGYFYKCTQAVTYYTIVAEDESITCYCKELPELGQRAALYTDVNLTIELSGKELLHITTGYDIVDTGASMGINTTQTPNIEYTWEQLNVQPGGVEEVTASDINSENASDGRVLTANGQGNAEWRGVDLKFTYLTITLDQNDWAIDNTQTVNVPNVTADSIIWVSPTPTDSNISNYKAAGLYASAQGSGTITFKASSAPAADINVNIIINNAPNSNIQENSTLYINQVNEQIVQNGDTLIIGGNN